jgi:hypothetical protein
MTALNAAKLARKQSMIIYKKLTEIIHTALAFVLTYYGSVFFIFYVLHHKAEKYY